MMNVHHLELFYYVARHKGIMNACRRMPYGVQQPAVSAQMITLEKDLGLRLFHRKPFQLTPAGERLYQYVAPFFGEMELVEAELRGELAQEIRLAGIGQLMHEHVPVLLSKMKKRFPQLKVRMYERTQEESRKLLEEGEADLAVTVLDSVQPAGIHTKPIIELPLALFVGPGFEKFKSATALLRSLDDQGQTLVSLPEHEILTKLFHETLKARGIDWPVSMEVSSLPLVVRYVEHGFGVGLGVRVPGSPLPDGVRELVLKDFPKLPVGALWRGPISEVGQVFVDGLIERAKTLQSGK